MRAISLFLCAGLLQAAGPSDQGVADLRAAVERAIQRGVTPGAVLWVDQGGHARHWAQGRRAVLPAPETMREDTLFDVASLTKVVATLPATLLLLERGKLELEAPVQRYLPEFQVPTITLRHLLTHTSGLPAGLPKDPQRLDWSGYDEGVRQACACRPDVAPGTLFRYSDVNFILLGEIVRRVSGLPLDAFAQREVFGPLGMKDTGFRPSARLKARVAPTERDERGVLLRGVVHDPTSRRMGGVAGHAGLFSTSADLARFARAMLRGGLLKPATMALMRAEQTPPTLPDRRGLGWDLDTRYSRPRGLLYPVGSYGHTGFTGTALWLDPSTDSFYILLTTRLHPSGSGDTKDLYAEVGTLAARAVGLRERPPKSPAPHFLEGQPVPPAP